MSGAMFFPHWEFDAEALRMAALDEGYGTDADLEDACHLRRGRIAEYAANGWQPHLWEFRRICLVLDYDMDVLFDEVFVPRERS